MHIRSLHLTTPKVYANFIKELTSRKYAVEGEVRKGYAQVHIAEAHLLDMRLKREIVTQVLTDMCALDPGNKYHLGHKIKNDDGTTNNVSHHINPFVRLITTILVKLLRKLTSHDVPEYGTNELIDTKQTVPKKGWMYSFLIGCYKDPEYTQGQEEL
jgi:hypothetical protein